MNLLIKNSIILMCIYVPQFHKYRNQDIILYVVDIACTYSKCIYSEK